VPLGFCLRTPGRWVHSKRTWMEGGASWRSDSTHRGESTASLASRSCRAACRPRHPGFARTLPGRSVPRTAITGSSIRVCPRVLLRATAWGFKGLAGSPSQTRDGARNRSNESRARVRCNLETQGTGWRGLRSAEVSGAAEVPRGTTTTNGRPEPRRESRHLPGVPRAPVRG